MSCDAATPRHSQRRIAWSGLATGRWGEKQRKGAAPRPPQLHRRHEPCTLTDPLTPPEFVEHLKTINWYKQQARTAHPAPETCSSCGSLRLRRVWQQCTERKLAHRRHSLKLPRTCQCSPASPSEVTRLTMHMCLADRACGGHPGKGAQVWQAGAPAVASRHSHAGAQGHQEPLLPPGRGPQCCGSRCARMSQAQKAF